MTEIERRQARIRRIREQLNTTRQHLQETDMETTSPYARYHIGKTQNQPEHIIGFVQKHIEDPAVKVSYKFSS